MPSPYYFQPTGPNQGTPLGGGPFQYRDLTSLNATVRQWTLESIIAPPPLTVAPKWWDGSAFQSAERVGWWDGVTPQPVESLGWWGGSSVQPIEPPT